jgi:carboxyl-terminal processing protease
MSKHRPPVARRGGVGFLLVGFAIGALVAGIGGVSLWAIEPRESPSRRGPYAALSQFGAALEKIRDHYVDEVSGRALVHSAIKGMLASLDPHSGYADGMALRATQSFVRGEIGEVGVELAERGGEITVVSPIDGASAERAGLLPGDAITEIDGVATHGLLLDEAAERLRGRVNSTVRLTIRRAKGGRVERVTVTRDVQRIRSVRSHVTGADIGYIRIAQFTETTAEGLRDALRALRAEIPAEVFKGYILDLRNDPGGYVDQAIATVNAFIDKGEIVSTRGRAPGSSGQVFAVPGGDLSRGCPLVVLVNGGTASAAEIVAGALQDLKRARLIGARTFGKGSIQSTLPLGDGELRLTTALYFTPSGRSIQAEGIVPDEVVLEDAPPDLAGAYASAGEASLDRHLANPRGENIGPSQTYVPPDPRDDRQLRAAVAWLRGGDGRGVGSSNAGVGGPVSEPH